MGASRLIEKVKQQAESRAELISVWLFCFGVLSVGKDNKISARTHSATEFQFLLQNLFFF